MSEAEAEAEETQKVETRNFPIRQQYDRLLKASLDQPLRGHGPRGHGQARFTLVR